MGFSCFVLIIYRERYHCTIAKWRIYNIHIRPSYNLWPSLNLVYTENLISATFKTEICGWNETWYHSQRCIKKRHLWLEFTESCACIMSGYWSVKSVQQIPSFRHTAPGWYIQVDIWCREEFTELITVFCWRQWLLLLRLKALYFWYFQVLVSHIYMCVYVRYITSMDGLLR